VVLGHGATIPLLALRVVVLARVVIPAEKSILAFCSVCGLLLLWILVWPEYGVDDFFGILVVKCKEICQPLLSSPDQMSYPSARQVAEERWIMAWLAALSTKSKQGPQTEHFDVLAALLSYQPPQMEDGLGTRPSTTRSPSACCCTTKWISWSS